MLVSISLNQVTSDQAFFCSVNVSLVKNPNLERFWCLETIGIMDPIGRESDDKILEIIYIIPLGILLEGNKSP